MREDQWVGGDLNMQPELILSDRELRAVICNIFCIPVNTCFISFLTGHDNIEFAHYCVHVCIPIGFHLLEVQGEALLQNSLHIPMGGLVPSLHRESTDSLITFGVIIYCFVKHHNGSVQTNG